MEIVLVVILTVCLLFQDTKSESPNVTHGYAEDSTVFEGSNTTITDVSSNTIDDQLLEVTSSLRNAGKFSPAAEE